MKTETVDFKAVDAGQQARWEAAGLFRSPQLPRAGKKFYCLDMFPYPSGQGLHVGHPEGYTASDILVRYKRMSGFDVLHPMGWDAFGLPAENYAIETGIHPEITTRKNIATFKRQIKSLGLAYDWDREVSTMSPDYYRWTQWIFLQLFKKGLAYEGVIPINWCPSCKTGLANEEVFDGKCERCSAQIEQKKMRQWLLKITAYADRLLDDMQGLNWPESTLAMQRNWIGRSEGAEIIFEVSGSAEKITVFTTRPDTIYGATYMVLAPEHPLVGRITSAAQRAQVAAYVKSSAAETEFERLDAARDKTGVFTGAYAVNPITGRKIPVWIADYVIYGYGTGAIMAVPAHDERDWAFAKKFGLEIVEVVKPQELRQDAPVCFAGEGIAVNSGIIDGLPTAQAKEKIAEYLAAKGIGSKKITYRLRDWVFCRQRYWGEPIPIVHCAACGAVPVPEAELPLLLPAVEKFEPTGTGESPLSAVASWVNTKCPACGGPAKRETNTMPQWAGSCWYYLRYLDPRNETQFCSPAAEKGWMPVDCYIGGSEHAVLHLLYARFWHKVLYDLGHVSTIEPFQKLRHQGMILSYSYRDARGVYYPYRDIDFSKESEPRLRSTGEALTAMVEKMSKSKKNVVNPDEILAEYGADAFRLYEMFMGPFDASKPWDMKGIEGVSRFLKRIWFWADSIGPAGGAVPPALDALRHKTIAKVTSDIEQLKFNTAISALMVFFNELQAAKPAPRDAALSFLKLLHPFAPHATDAIWQRLGEPGFILNSAWPEADKAKLADQEIEIAVQVNGKVRGRVIVAAGADEETVRRLALDVANVKAALAGKAVQKIMVIPRRVVSIVAK